MLDLFTFLVNETTRMASAYLCLYPGFQKCSIMSQHAYKEMSSFLLILQCGWLQPSVKFHLPPSPIGWKISFWYSPGFLNCWKLCKHKPLVSQILFDLGHAERDYILKHPCLIKQWWPKMGWSLMRSNSKGF
jgi:hypothetical protein